MSTDREPTDSPMIERITESLKTGASIGGATTINKKLVDLVLSQGACPPLLRTPQGRIAAEVLIPIVVMLVGEHWNNRRVLRAGELALSGAAAGTLEKLLRPVIESIEKLALPEDKEEQ